MLHLPLTVETSWEEPAGFSSIEPPGTAPYKGREIQRQPSTTRLEPPAAEEERSSGPTAVSQEAEVPEEDNQLSKAPKISFRVRGVLAVDDS